MRRTALAVLMLLACWYAAEAAHAADLKVPERVAAGDGVTIQTQGNGDPTLYLFGPGGAVKRSVLLGQVEQLKPEEVRHAGQYTVIVNGQAASFWVTSNATARLSFLAGSSRLAVALSNVI